MGETRRLMNSNERIDRAVDLAEQYGMIDGGHHKQWVIDQMIRALLGDAYKDWVDEMNSDEGYEPWNTGIAP